MICYPNAKINLGLKILSKRKDGFHNINSFFLPIPLFDILELQIPNSPLNKNKITYSGLNCVNIENDLVIKAYNLLNHDFLLSPIKIHLHKNIPFGSGLGGGSSDAAFMLIMLNNLFGLKLTAKQLLKYAMNLGSDCPFFIFNHFSHVSSVGNIIKPVDFCFQGYNIVIIKPDIHCSTHQIFSKHILKQSNQEPLNFNNNPVLWKNELINDLELVTFSMYPELKKIKDYLYSKGALYASMTGSGSSIYALFDHIPEIRNKFNSWFWQGSL